MLMLDWIVVGAYAVLMLGVGIYFARASAKGMKSYFLGDNNMPWWALSSSGAASNFDIAGTMWIVSMVGVFGMRSFWAFLGFAIFNAAFLMSYLAPWIRRTRVMTAVELMKARFGDGADGRLARMAAAIGMVVLTSFLIGYAAAGVGKFTAYFIPWDLGVAPGQKSFVCAIGVMSLTTLYVLIGGFKSVIVTDVIQAILMSLCGLLIGITAMFILDVETLHNSGFITNLLPVWEWDGDLPENMAADGYTLFGAMAVLFLLNGLIHSTGGAGGTYGEQRFLAARTVTDSARAGAAWGFIIIPRFFLIAGVTFVVLTGAVQQPGDPELLLPHLISSEGMIPVGIRGFLVAALLAAFMSTFSSTINAGAGIFVRDVVQPIWPDLGQRPLVLLSYAATAFLLFSGLAIGMYADSINSIWLWIQLGFLPAMLVPNVMRWYWWRVNGLSYALSMFGTMIVATTFLILKESDSLVLPPYIATPILYVFSSVSCAAIALMTKPTREEKLDEFYRLVRPKGLWGPVRQRVGVLPALLGPDATRGRIVLNTILGIVMFMCSYFSVFYVIGHWFLYGGICLVLAAGAAGILYKTWYCPLLEAERDELIARESE